MQSSNPIAPARRGSFALALAVTVASLIMGGEVALAEDQTCSNLPEGAGCISSVVTSLPSPLGATFHIKNNFATEALFGATRGDSDFWIYCFKDGGGQWYYEDTLGCYYKFGTGCYIKLTDIKKTPDGGYNIYLAQTSPPGGAVIQAVLWPQTTAPGNPPAVAPPGVAPSAGSGSYAAYAMLELTADAVTNASTTSNIDLTVLNGYTFAHQLLYWNSSGCVAPPSTQPPTTAAGFNGKLTSAGIYTALTAALGTTASSTNYYPANYPDSALMRLNGATAPNWSNYVYNEQSGEWALTPGGAPLEWGLPTDYLQDDYNNGVSTCGRIAQNYPIDTGGTAYPQNAFGLWHPSKSTVTTAKTMDGTTTDINVVQVFGNKYGGDTGQGYLKALHAAMPAGGYKFSRAQALSVDPGSYPSYSPRIGCNGYSFNLIIDREELNQDLYDYNLQLTDIHVFNAPNCGAGIVGDPTFQTTDLNGSGDWYPSVNCGTPLEYQMYNPPRGRTGVPTDPLMCLLLEGAGPNYLPAQTLSDKYDYPYVYTKIVVVPGVSGTIVAPYGPVGGPVYANYPTDQHTLLTDDYHAVTNPHGTGRPFSPPGLSAFRRYLAEQGVYEVVAAYSQSDLSQTNQTWIKQTQNGNPPGYSKAPVGTVVYEFAGTTGTTGQTCSAVPQMITCLNSGGNATNQWFSSGYYGNYLPGPGAIRHPWSGGPSVGTGLKSCYDVYQNTALGITAPGEPFTWLGPFYGPNSASISVNYYRCIFDDCDFPFNGPGDRISGPANGWVKLTYCPKPLQKSIYWTWPPAESQLDPPTTSAGVKLTGRFNWDGSQSLVAGPARIKVGSNGYAEGYLREAASMKWQTLVTPAGNHPVYSSSGIPWSQQWAAQPNGGPWFPPPGASFGSPLSAGLVPNEQFWGGGAVVPYLGNWTDAFVNMGGAPSKALVMYAKNYTDTSPSAEYGPHPNIQKVGAAGADSGALYGFDPFIKAENWPMEGEPVAIALQASEVADASLEGWFSQCLIASMLGDVSTVIQYGLLTDSWNSSGGIDYYFNAVGSPGLPFNSKTPKAVFQVPSPGYTGTVGNEFIKTLLANSLGYGGNGSFPETTRCISPYVSSYGDRFANASPDFKFIPGSSYFQWNLGVPTISSVSDIDGDGCVGSKDLTMLLAAWGACGKGNCPEDLNQDGIVDGGDLVHVLAEWGVGCGSP